MNRKTQKQDIIKHLKRRYLSNWDAYELLGCTKLGTRVSELIQQGYSIDKRRVKVTTRYGAKVNVVKYKILKSPNETKKM